MNCPLHGWRSTPRSQSADSRSVRSRRRQSCCPRSSTGRRGTPWPFSPCGDTAACVLWSNHRGIENRVADELQVGALVKAWIAVAITAGLVTAPLWLVAPRGWPPQRRRALAWGGAHVAAAFTIFWFMPYILVPLIRPADLARWFFVANVEPGIANRLALT